MNLLVTLQEASDHLRRDTSDDDSDLTLKLYAASQAVLNYIGLGADFLDSNLDVIEDSNGEPLNVPFPIKAATLLMLGELYSNRGGEGSESAGMGYLPKSVTALLYHYREPTVE